MLLYHLPYFLTTLTLTEPTGRLTSSQPRDAAVWLSELGLQAWPRPCREQYVAAGGLSSSPNAETAGALIHAQPWDNICNKVDKSWQDNIHCLFPIMSFKYCYHHIPLERSLLGRTRHIYIQLTCSLLHKVAQNSLPVFDQVKMKCFLFFEIFSRVYFSDNYRLSFTKLPFPTLKYSITF